MPPRLFLRGDIDRPVDGLIDDKADSFVVDDHLETLTSGFEPMTTGQSLVDPGVRENADTIKRVEVRTKPKDLSPNASDRAVAIRLSLPGSGKRFRDERVQFLRHVYSLD